MWMSAEESTGYAGWSVCSDTANAWDEDSKVGECAIDSTGLCYQSPNYPSNYAAGESECEITTTKDMELTAASFVTGTDDFLEVEMGDCKHYYGTGEDHDGTALTNIQVEAGQTMDWNPDNEDDPDGSMWKVCYHETIASTAPKTRRRRRR